LNQISELSKIYRHHIGAPWQPTLAGAQRVMMVVYAKERERALRTRIVEFEQATHDEGHNWEQIDATGWFAEWMASHEYRDTYFEHPELLESALRSDFRDFAVQRFTRTLDAADDNTVVALVGAASLYGFMRVSDLIHSVESQIRGRLAVFFPGSKNDNNYRLLDARDGWSYLALPITLHGEWIP